MVGLLKTKKHRLYKQSSLARKIKLLHLKFPNIKIKQNKANRTHCALFLSSLLDGKK